MSQVSGLGGTTQSNSTAGHKINELNMDDFLKLMISELQNQDPLNPTDNSQMLQQISQIREIGSTDKLTSTLDSVLLGQNMVSATTMIGKQVKGIGEDGRNVEGTVDRVTVVGGSPSVHIGDTKLKLSNISEIAPG